MNNDKVCLYLDDERTPTEMLNGYQPWYIVRNYDQFVEFITEHCKVTGKLPDLISFDHDLQDEHVKYFVENPMIKIDYQSFKEKTGLHCAKYMIELCLKNNINFKDTRFCVHSHNPVGAENIQLYINNAKKVAYGAEFQDCYKQKFKFTLDENRVQKS